jgi:hypothetical protein
MNNRETFVEKLNSCGEIKYEVSEVHNRVQNKLKNVYGLAFKTDKKNFGTLKTMQYFKGGVENPDARSKILDMLDKFINLVNHYEFIGDKEIVNYLAERGIQLTVLTPEIVDGPIVIEKDDEKEFNRSWSFAMPGEAAPATKKELLDKILKRSLEVQKDIENKNEQIEDGAKTVEDACSMKKALFMKALGIKYKELQKRSVDNELLKVEDELEATQDVVNYFKEGVSLDNANVAVVKKDDEILKEEEENG